DRLYGWPHYTKVGDRTVAVRRGADIGVAEKVERAVIEVVAIQIEDTHCIGAGAHEAVERAVEKTAAGCGHSSGASDCGQPGLRPSQGHRLRRFLTAATVLLLIVQEASTTRSAGWRNSAPVASSTYITPVALPSRCDTRRTWAPVEIDHGHLGRSMAE